MAAPHVYLEQITLTDEEARNLGIPPIIRLHPHDQTKIGATELGGQALSPYVSNSMCFINWENGRLFVERSMQAKNGMRLNNTDLVATEKRELFPNDILSFAPLIKLGKMTHERDGSWDGVWSNALMYKVVWETGFEFHCVTCASSGKQTVIYPFHKTACAVCKKSGDGLLLKQVKVSRKRDESDSPGH